MATLLMANIRAGAMGCRTGLSQENGAGGRPKQYIQIMATGMPLCIPQRQEAIIEEKGIRQRPYRGAPRLSSFNLGGTRFSTVLLRDQHSEVRA
jgi:hypothetical protein